MVAKVAGGVKVAEETAVATEAGELAEQVAITATPPAGIIAVVPPRRVELLEKMSWRKPLEMPWGRLWHFSQSTPNKLSR